MAEKKASLTVLGGPLAGTRFVLEGVGFEVILGADPACQFQLALTGVSAQHARIRTDASAYTIEDAGSEHGLHVNDSRVTAAVPLRNGDIVWLGTPGEADVVMLQCILPSRPVAAAAPPPPAPEPSLSEDETLALALAAETAAAPQTDLMEQAATGFYTADEAAAASGAPFAADSDDAAAVPFASAGDNDLVVADDETVAQAVPFAVDAVPPPPPPVHFEDDTREQTYEFDEEDQATVVMGTPADVAPAAVYPSDTGFMEDDPSTVIMASEPEPTMAIEAPPTPVAQPPKTEFIPKPTVAPAKPAAPAPAPAPVRAAPPPAVVATPPAAPRPPRPAASPAPAPRKPAPRPPTSPRVADEGLDDPGTPERGARKSPPVALYAGLGAVALAALGGGYWALTKFRGAAPSPSMVADAPPATQPVARPTPRPTALPSEPPIEVPVEVQPESVATPPPALPTPVAVPTPTGGPTTTLRGVPSPLPSPSPAAKKGVPTPAPAATPAGPSPEQVRAQQVAGLLGQADAALASGQFDQAIGHFDEVLRLDPGNGKATADRASAVSQRDASRKKFVAGRTVVKTEKASGGLAGFEGAEVQRTPDFSGRIEFEMSPASGLKSGDAWTLKFYLVNDGKKGIKVGGVTATTNVNGTGAGGPVAPSTREVAPQQRAQLGQLTGSWREGTTAWVADVLVTANKGDSLKNTLTWR